MALIIQRIELDRFRNWTSLCVQPAEGLTVIVGPNAAGKTNIIEAIQLLTTGRSFRAPRWNDVVTSGSEAGSIRLVAEGDGRLRDVKMVFGEDGRRSIFVNGTKKRGAASVGGPLPSVLFTPDDLGIVKDSAQRRRDEIDGLGEQLSATYRDIKSQYDRALRQRNALLKQDAVDDELFRAWTMRLAELGSALALHRYRLFTRLKEPIERRYRAVSGGETLQVSYDSAWWMPAEDTERDDVLERMSNELERRSADERVRRVTLVGPHRDDIMFTVDGRDSRSQASQGQQRTIALAWKMAEVQVVEDMTGESPVLLLDDVMSELDATRRQELTAVVSGVAQTVVTTTNLGYFAAEVLERAEVITLDGKEESR